MRLRPRVACGTLTRCGRAWPRPLLTSRSPYAGGACTHSPRTHAASNALFLFSPPRLRPRRKNKFCVFCNGKRGDLHVSAARVRGLPEQLHDLVMNSSEGGVWSVAANTLGEARFRVVNNTAVSAPHIDLFSCVGPPRIAQPPQPCHPPPRPHRSRPRLRPPESPASLLPVFSPSTAELSRRRAVALPFRVASAQSSVLLYALVSLTIVPPVALRPLCPLCPLHPLLPCFAGLLLAAPHHLRA